MSSPNDSDQTAMSHRIHDWRSILTPIVFLLTNLVVMFPFSIRLPIHARLVGWTKYLLSVLHIASAETRMNDRRVLSGAALSKGAVLTIPFNFVTVPVLSVFVLTAMQIIGKKEYRGGTIGTNNINPIDIMTFFLTLAYLAISIDTTGLIRFLAFWVLKKGEKDGHQLYFLLFVFFFVLGSFIGNDPIILSGTAFLAYLTRLAANIRQPRAWIYAQFAVANISSAILVSSNPSNLVLSGAFALSFVQYTLNMIIPVIATVIILFPFLLYIIFSHEDLIPHSIGLQSTEDENMADIADAEEEHRQTRNAELAETIDPYLDGKGALLGGVLLAITLTTLLATNAAGLHPGVWTMTVPAGSIMLCRDLWHDWGRRHQTRAMARERKLDKARKIRLKEEATKIRRARAEAGMTDNYGSTEAGYGRPDGALGLAVNGKMSDGVHASGPGRRHGYAEFELSDNEDEERGQDAPLYSLPLRRAQHLLTSDVERGASRLELSVDDVPMENKGDHRISGVSQSATSPDLGLNPPLIRDASTIREVESDAMESPSQPIHSIAHIQRRRPRTLYDVWRAARRYSIETFPTVSTVIGHLPFALLPFGFSAFILVEALVSQGWVDVLAHGWARWVKATGVVGAIGGMGFCSVLLCNIGGTNIGASILLSRVIQSWLGGGESISDRYRDASIYALALGVNYGAFSATFSASIVGILWRDILRQKHINVKRLDFARVNLPIIAVAMSVGCGILAAQVYIFKDGTPKIRVLTSA